MSERTFSMNTTWRKLACIQWQFTNLCARRQNAFVECHASHKWAGVKSTFRQAPCAYQYRLRRARPNNITVFELSRHNRFLESILTFPAEDTRYTKGVITDWFLGNYPLISSPTLLKLSVCLSQQSKKKSLQACQKSLVRSRQPRIQS